MSRVIVAMILTIAMLFLAICIGDTIAGSPAVWGLLGWPVPLLVLLAIFVARDES